MYPQCRRRAKNNSQCLPNLLSSSWRASSSSSRPCPRSHLSKSVMQHWMLTSNALSISPPRRAFFNCSFAVFSMNCSADTSPSPVPSDLMDWQEFLLVSTGSRQENHNNRNPTKSERPFHSSRLRNSASPSNPNPAMRPSLNANCMRHCRYAPWMRHSRYAPRMRHSRHEPCMRQSRYALCMRQSRYALCMRQSRYATCLRLSRKTL